MKFIKDMFFDIKNGLLKNYSLLVLPVVLSIILFFYSKDQIKLVLNSPEVNVKKASFADVWFYLYGGMKPYVPSADNPFQIPVIWIGIFIIVSFLVLNYPVNNMLGIGSHILVQTGGRGKWWLSKCIWNITSTLIYHFVFIMVLVILCGMFDYSLNIDLHMEAQERLFDIWGEMKVNEEADLAVGMIIVPILISIAINLVQMTLSLFIKTVFSFLVISATMLSSVYFLSPVMIGNYAMPLRYNSFIEQGVSYKCGALVAIAVIFITSIVGLVRFKKYDILNWEEN